MSSAKWETVNSILFERLSQRSSACLCVVWSQVEALNVSLSDNTEALAETQKHLIELQAIATASEHDRRVLLQRLDVTRSALVVAVVVM